MILFFIVKKTFVIRKNYRIKEEHSDLNMSIFTWPWHGVKLICLTVGAHIFTGFLHSQLIPHTDKYAIHRRTDISQSIAIHTSNHLSLALVSPQVIR